MIILLIFVKFYLFSFVCNIGKDDIIIRESGGIC